MKETENGKKENCCLKFFRRFWTYWTQPKKRKSQIGAIRWRELKSNRKMEACYLPCFIFLGLIWYGTRYFLHDAGIFVQESIKPGSSTAQIASFPDWGWVIMLATVAIVSIGTTRIIYRRLMLYALEERKLFQETSPFRRASLMISQSLPPVQNTEEKTETTDEITNESDTNESGTEITRASADTILNPEQIQEVLVRLGEISIGKNADWLISVGERRLVLPR